jgi:general stress protein YciG
MGIGKVGPEPGSEGARKIAEAHRGSHEHDKIGGFAANPELAREAGRKGGQAVKKKYGPSFYRQIGKKGGNVIKQSKPDGYYKEIGSRGGKERVARLRASQQKAEEVTP